MKNLLVFSFFPAFVPPKSGGESRLFNFYFELSNFFNITLLSSGHLNSELETIWHTNNFVEKRVPKDSVFGEQWQYLTPHAGEGDLSGPCIAASGKFLTEMHKVYLESYPDSDVIIHEFPFTLDYDLFRGIDDKLRVYNSHNCEYELYKKLHAQAPSNHIIELVRDVEVRLLKLAGLVTYCGDDDLPAFERLLRGKLPRAVFIPNGMTKISVSKEKSNEKIKRAVFIGSGHLPNVQAAEFIVETLAPACPEVIFDIIGNCCPPGEYPANVVRHGVVETKLKSELIAAADIAINPMLGGSGSSLKILDFVAHGVPVLSTPIGMRGFDFQDGKDCLLAEAEEFPKFLKKYANELEFLEMIGTSARRFALERYSWSAISNKFSNLIEEQLEKHKKDHRLDPFVLALNDYDPFDTIGGGATRLQGLYAAMAEWSNVVVMCFSEGTTIEVADIGEKIKCIRIPKTPEHLEEVKYFNSRFYISANDIVALRHAGHNRVLNDVYDVLRRHARIVVCDHPYMVPLPRRFGDRFVYSSHNFEYKLKKDLMEWHPDKDELINEVFNAERFCVASSALVVAVSAEDAENFTRGVNAAAPIMVVPNGASVPVTPNQEDVSAVREKINSRSAVFLGSAHIPNVDAAKFIVESLAPDCPDVEFHLVGSVCQAIPNHLPSNVTAWGVLSESMKSAVLQHCKVAINPMFSGSGSNIKLSDFLANGLYVVSTNFGIRGYPDLINSHVTIANQESFAEVLQNILDVLSISDEVKRMERRALFIEHLSMRSLAKQFVNLLKELEQPKKRMLFVTYRYTAPALGGAESMLLKLITGIGNSGEFVVDVVAPEVSSIKEVYRFGSHYESDPDVCAPVGLRNVRFVRFPLARDEGPIVDKKLLAAWCAQSEFEKQLYMSIKSSIINPGLVWGWGYPEGDKENVCRWGFAECGLHLTEYSTVRVVGFVPHAAVVRVCDSEGAELLHKELDSYFEFCFEANAGAVAFYVSCRHNYCVSDPRPLAMYIRHIYLNEIKLNLGTQTVLQPTHKDAFDIYLKMERAANLSRDRQSVSLTDIRGPHSPDLESFLEEYTKYYDIVVTHNNVFRSPVTAISAAKAANVPSVLIPHAHLDDDFYHFPDVHQSALDADLVLAAPKAVCRFYERIGVRQVGYLPAGIDSTESFSNDDESAFRSIFTRFESFFLVLGRKAIAKGYLDVIREIENLNLSGKQNVHLVLIGPDDDGIPVTSSYATYLGRQPRNVVRGALMSCIGLINMSSSESFGIVLLEAWLAGKPVIANVNCSAFHDLAVHEENALLVSKETLGTAMDKLTSNEALRKKLGDAGKGILNQYDWERVCANFLSFCRDYARVC